MMAQFDIGRAKTRAFEFNSGNAVQLIWHNNIVVNSSTNVNTYKHYLFDIEMFAHLNVRILCQVL